MKSISFIVPAYNEEKTIRVVLERLIDLDLGLEKEIIVVDDGSKDGTVAVVQEMKGKSDLIKLIIHKKNSGKGSAIHTGFRNAKGDIITIQDADLEYNLDDFKRLVQPILRGECKIVYGSRFLKKNDRGNGFFYLGNRFLSLVTSVLYATRITDMETCYKLFHRSTIQGLETIKSRGFDVEPEITSKMLRRGFKINELSIDYFPRNRKAGKKIRVIDGFKALIVLFRYRFR